MLVRAQHRNTKDMTEPSQHTCAPQVDCRRIWHVVHILLRHRRHTRCFSHGVSVIWTQQLQCCRQVAALMLHQGCSCPERLVVMSSCESAAESSATPDSQHLIWRLASLSAAPKTCWQFDVGTAFVQAALAAAAGRWMASAADCTRPSDILT